MEVVTHDGITHHLYREVSGQMLQALKKDDFTMTMVLTGEGVFPQQPGALHTARSDVIEPCVFVVDVVRPGFGHGCRLWVLSLIHI